MTVPRRRFDPAAHLSKHGWQGKGTALKNGHSVRPLPTVKKQTLSGIGKDRDEAIPFWDHVFAATAANLKSVSNSPTPVVSAQATPRVSSPPPTPKTSLGVEVRKGKEAARRGLYSRFLRGVVLGPQEEDEIAALTEVTELVVAGPSSTTEVSPEGDGHEIMKSDKRSKRKAEKTRKTQTPDGTGQKMEKKIARKLAKAKRKAEKELRRASKRPREDAETEVRRAETVPDEVSRRKKKRKKASEA